METKRLGNSDMNITRIGLGTWAIGGTWRWGWGEQDDSNSIATIREAIDHGINWIDTAAVYGLGHSEEIVGKALREMKDKPYVFTKGTKIWDSAGNVSESMKAESLRKEVEASLVRLGVEVIDLYQIHWPIPDEQIEEGWETLAKLKDEGKIRYIGVSNFSVSQLRRAEKIAPVTSLQPPYNLIRQDVAKEILPYCEQQNIGVIVYSPMASGLLSGKMSRERIAAMDPTDWRKTNPDFTEPNITRNLAFQKLLAEIATQYDATAGEVAIAWTLINPAVTGAIVGMRKPGQIDGVIRAVELKLSDAEILRMESFLNSR